ncbi:MAG: hypothetical protein IT200_04145 [Thermoleophilia bacterium]|nr:hypothetical protein [Thermoleophilia bacterium]
MSRRVSFLAAMAATLAAVPLASAATPALTSGGQARPAPRLIATGAPTAPPPVQLAALGTDPDAIVDAAGTAHLVWNEPHDDGPDVTVYCRIPRAARACDITQRLVPPGGDVFADDAGGPQVIAVNDQVVVLSHRFPQEVAKPGGDPSLAGNTLYLWASDDGGRTFQSPGIVGVANPDGESVAFGSPDNPLVGTITNTKTGGIEFSAVSAGRFQPTAAALAPGDFFEGRMTVVNGIPSVTYHDGGPTSYVRTWSGQGDPSNAATWGAPSTFPGLEPDITNAGGRLVATAKRPGTAVLELRDLASGAVRKLSTGQAGSQVTPIGLPDGSTTVVWQGTEHLVPGVWRRDRVGATGAVTGIPTLVSTEEGISMIAAATDDGGGVTVRDTVDKRILLSGFGNTLPTGLPGLGNAPGGGAPPADVAVDCQKIQLGASVQALLDGPCFLSASRGGVKVSDGPFRLNGLEIIPDAGVQVQIDLRAKTIRSTGTVTVKLRAPGIPDITLFRGRLDITASGKRAGAVLATFGEKLFKPDLLGFPVRGDIDIKLAGTDGVRIPVSLELPKEFSDVRGSAELIVNNRQGLVLDSLDFRADGVPLGPATLRRMRVQYRAEGGTAVGDCLIPASSGAVVQPHEWAGVFELELPPPKTGPGVCGSIRFGSPDGFRAATFRVDLPYPGVVLFPGLSLTSLGGGLQVRPAQVDGTFKLEVAGVSSDASAAQVTGRLTARFTDPLLLTGTAKFTAAGMDIGDGTVKIASDGYATLDLTSGPTFGIFSIRAAISGWLDAPARQFSIHGRGETCMDLGTEVCLDGFEAAVSSKGIAICRGVIPTPVPVPFPPGVVTPPRGAGYHWGDTFPSIWPISCYASEYAVPGSRQLAVSADPVAQSTADLAAGAAATFRVAGAAGVPVVDLVAPDGTVVTPDADVADATAKARYLAVKAPAAGRWTVRTRDGLPGIAELAVSRDQAAPGVTGVAVTGAARKRTLRYRATFGAGQGITFLERGRAGTRVLGAAAAGRGTLGFTPGPGAGGRRQIVAQFIQDGLVREEKAVGSYVAPPPPVPGRALGLRIRRAGPAVVVTWRPGANAGRQRLVAKVPGGPLVSRLLTGRARTARIPGIDGRAVTVTVTAFAATGRAGGPVRITLPAARR